MPKARLSSDTELKAQELSFLNDRLNKIGLARALAQIQAKV